MNKVSRKKIEQLDHLADFWVAYFIEEEASGGFQAQKKKFVLEILSIIEGR